MPQKFLSKFNHLALGGTFDRFHRGHREFLEESFRLSRIVTIGVTSDAFARKLHAGENIQPFSKRSRRVGKFLERRGLGKRGRMIKLEDIHGPTLKDESVEALLVTQSTLPGAVDINSQRRKLGKKHLEVVRLPLIKAADGNLLSSNRIRDGEVSREGVVFLDQLLNDAPVILPQEFRVNFREPFGKVFPHHGTNIYASMEPVADEIRRRDLHPIISVGDLVTHALLKIGEEPKIVIIDFMVQRQKRFSSLSDIGSLSHYDTQAVRNQSGTIAKKLVQLIHKAFKQNRSAIVVKGEEDLAVLPCILLAPLGSVVVYGHFQEGIIAVEVTEKKKQESLKLLQQLTRISREE